MKKKILAALATASVAVSSIAASVSAAGLGDSTSVKPSEISNVVSNGAGNGKVPTTGDASTTLLLVAGAVAVVALTTIIVAVKAKKAAK